MKSSHPSNPRRQRQNLSKLHRQVREKSARKLQAQREQDRNPWYGLGLLGIVGWSVVVPTLLGVAIGLWLDARWQSSYSWTLMLMLVGLVIGCLNAWYWVQQESRDG